MTQVISTKTSHLFNGFSLPCNIAVDVPDSDVDTFLTLDGVIKANNTNDTENIEDKVAIPTEIHTLEDKINKLTN